MKILTWGICLVVFCLPLYLLRFEVFGIPTTVLEILIYALFIFWLLDKLIQNTKYKIPATKSFFIPIILILIGVSLATVFSSDLRTSAGIWKAWFIDPLLFFVVVISVIKNSEQIKKILCSLLLSGTAVAVISLIYLLQGKFDPVGRLQAFYNSPNYLAMYLAPGLILSLWLIFTEKKKALKILFFVFCFLFFATLFFTKSFGAWLGIIVAIGLGLYCLTPSVKHRRVILCVILIAILALGYFALIQRESSFEARLIIWQKALEIYKTNPIIGIGPGTFEEAPQPHSIFLAFLLQTGIIGFIGFVWLLIWFYRPKAGQPRADIKKTSIVLMMIMTYILIHGLVDTLYWKNDLAVIFWFIIALCCITIHLSCSRKINSPPEVREINQ